MECVLNVSGQDYFDPQYGDDFLMTYRTFLSQDQFSEAVLNGLQVAEFLCVTELALMVTGSQTTCTVD